MRRPHRRLLTVVVVAVLSIAIGLLLAHATGQYVRVFAAQVVVAGLLAAWWAKPKKDSAPKK